MRLGPFLPAISSLRHFRSLPAKPAAIAKVLEPESQPFQDMLSSDLAQSLFHQLTTTQICDPSDLNRFQTVVNRAGGLDFFSKLCLDNNQWGLALQPTTISCKNAFSMSFLTFGQCEERVYRLRAPQVDVFNRSCDQFPVTIGTMPMDVEGPSSIKKYHSIRTDSGKGLPTCLIHFYGSANDQGQLSVFAKALLLPDGYQGSCHSHESSSDVIEGTISFFQRTNNEELDPWVLEKFPLLPSNSSYW